jgi:hypothetical protein
MIQDEWRVQFKVRHGTAPLKADEDRIKELVELAGAVDMRMYEASARFMFFFIGLFLFLLFTLFFIYLVLYLPCLQQGCYFIFISLRMQKRFP